MRFRNFGAVLSISAVMSSCSSAFADASAFYQPLTPPSASSVAPNTTAVPKQILRTGINLDSTDVSVNTVQLADTIKLTPVLERMRSLRAQVDGMQPSPERSEARLQLLECKEQAMQMITRTSLEADFVMAEMSAEQNLYSEILSKFTNDRDKLVARVNAGSFISNGVLWAVCESLAIPTHTRSVFAVSSGIVGIAAGLVPSVASMYTLKAVNGKKKMSEVEPNMLAKLFNYPTNPDIEYPRSIWLYLNQVPADSTSSKTRKEQMINRWVADSNIPNFTSGSSRAQLDVLTASVSQKKGLSISTLSARQVMLEQLSSEVMKVKRMLLELAMVVQGEKQLVATQTPTLH